MAAQHAATFWISLLRRFSLRVQAYGGGGFTSLFSFTQVGESNDDWLDNMNFAESYDTQR